MTLKQLSKQGDGLSAVELKDLNLRLLHRAMKRHNVDFAAVKDGKGKHTLFFKGKDADSITHAFKRYTQKLVKQADRKPSINKTLAAAKAAAQALNNGRDKVKNKDRGAR
jgi:predicted DCC family thiol-disulfide oxidoreductase YuxK